MVTGGGAGGAVASREAELNQRVQKSYQCPGSGSKLDDLLPVLGEGEEPRDVFSLSPQ